MGKPISVTKTPTSADPFGTSTPNTVDYLNPGDMVSPIPKAAKQFAAADWLVPKWLYQLVEEWMQW